jgi:cytochrome c oxidase subunit 2
MTTRGFRRRVVETGIAAGLAIAVTAGLAGCMPAPVTREGAAVRDLWGQFLIASVLVGGTVWILITVAVLRYRRRTPPPSMRPAAEAATGPRPTPMPAQTHGSTRLEVAWTLIPIAIILALFWLTLGTLEKIDARQPSAVNIHITAFRWSWRFEYPDEDVSVIGQPDSRPILVVPVGEPIHFVLDSADVAHSFYVPQFLFKRDAIPGKTNEFDITLTDPGDYGGQCAEFCGVFHDRMLLTVRAVDRATFDAWLADAAAGSASQPAASAASSPASAGPPSSGNPVLPSASTTP